MSARHAPVSAQVGGGAAGAAQRSVPVLAGGVPWLGHALQFARDPLALLRSGWERHGGAFELRMAGRRFVILAGPEAHDAWFRAPDRRLSAREVYRFTVPIFGRGVAYDAPEERMAEQLAFLHPALRESSMREHARRMQEEAEAWVRALAAEGELDLEEAMNELTVRIACRCLLGPEIRARVESGFARAYHDLQGGINTIGFFAPRLPTPAHRRRDRARRAVLRLIGEVLAERRREGRRREDLMQALMDARYGDGAALRDDEIAGLLLTALFAGQHTSSVLATWTGLELLAHPDYLARVRAEIDEVHGDEPRIDFDALKRQAVLERAIRECERLHPPLIILIRQACEDFVHAGFRIPAGRLVAVSPLLSHRLPGLFAAPDRFDPDRFAAPREEHCSARHALIGFGGGKHRCLGMHFAYLQIKALWTVLLSRLDLVLPGPVPQPDYGRWVTGPRPPCRTRYRRRERAR